MEEMKRLEKIADGRPMFIDLLPLVLYEVCHFLTLLIGQ